MSGNLKTGSRQLGAAHLITVDDVALTDWLRGLEAASLSDNLNDLSVTSPPQALWSVAVKGIHDSGGASGGTAYVVSAEVEKRIKARRYP